MTKEEKILEILTLIQNDEKLLLLIRTAISNNISSIEEQRIDILLAVLNG